jgi:hypothetical protein
VQVFIIEQPHQEERETTKAKDTQIAFKERSPDAEKVLFLHEEFEAKKFSLYENIRQTLSASTQSLNICTVGM